jgi:hypothetical protein
MDLAGDQEDLSLISGNIGNQAEKATPEEEKETPKIKETHPEVSRTSLESPIPQVSSIPMVNSTPLHMIFLFHRIQLVRINL